MKEVIKHYYKILKNKNIENFDHVKFKGRNVYNAKDFGKRMTFIHRKLKKLFLVPAIMLCEKWFKGKLKVEIEDSYQFRKVKAFDIAFEEALVKWNTLYRPYAYGDLKDSKVLLKDAATKRLRFIKELYNTVICNSYVENS